MNKAYIYQNISIFNIKMEFQKNQTSILPSLTINKAITTQRKVINIAKLRQDANKADEPTPGDRSPIKKNVY